MASIPDLDLIWDIIEVWSNGVLIYGFSEEVVLIYLKGCVL